LPIGGVREKGKKVLAGRSLFKSNDLKRIAGKAAERNSNRRNQQKEPSVGHGSEGNLFRGEGAETQIGRRVNGAEGVGRALGGGFRSTPRLSKESGGHKNGK